MMKAILLAAGVGSRITEDIGMMPKSLLDVGGKPLIIHTVELLKKNNIEVIVITGFKHRLMRHLRAMMLKYTTILSTELRTVSEVCGMPKRNF